MKRLTFITPAFEAVAREWNITGIHLVCCLHDGEGVWWMWLFVIAQTTALCVEVLWPSRDVDDWIDGCPTWGFSFFFNFSDFSWRFCRAGLGSDGGWLHSDFRYPLLGWCGCCSLATTGSGIQPLVFRWGTRSHLGWARVPPSFGSLIGICQEQLDS